MRWDYFSINELKFMDFVFQSVFLHVKKLINHIYLF